MLKNLKIFKVKFNVDGCHLVFQIIADRIENALPSAYKLCVDVVNPKFADNALNGQYLESVSITKADGVIYD